MIPKDLYFNYNDVVIGQFSLKITPPEVGSTIVLVESTGYAYSDENNKRIITSRVGKRSLAEYSWLSRVPMRFSPTSTVTGPVHSNSWIDFGGTCSAEVSSSDKNHSPPGVFGAGGPASFWCHPVPEIIFDGFIKDLRDIKKEAAADDAPADPPDSIGTCNGDTEGRGICYGGSGAAGYLVIFGGYVNDIGEGPFIDITGGSIVSIYRADSLEAQVRYWGGQVAEEVDLSQITPLLENHNMPDNGLIFLEDDVWVEGTVDGRATIGVTKFTAGEAKIRINGNITYADNRGGDDTLGLVCQGNIVVPKHAPSELVIEASLLSQQGKGLYVRYYCDPDVSPDCDPGALKTSIENYGGIVTFRSTGVKYGTPVLKYYHGRKIKELTNCELTNYFPNPLIR